MFSGRICNPEGTIFAFCSDFLQDSSSWQFDTFQESDWSSKTVSSLSIVPAPEQHQPTKCPTRFKCTMGLYEIISNWSLVFQCLWWYHIECWKHWRLSLLASILALWVSSFSFWRHLFPKAHHQGWDHQFCAFLLCLPNFGHPRDLNRLPTRRLLFEPSAMTESCKWQRL